MGSSHHLKRLPAPSFWPIYRKEHQWTVKPKPGPHSLNRCLPLLLVLREMLQLVRTRREAKYLLSKGNVKVNGRVRRNDDFPVGIMDVIEFPTIQKIYRVLPSTNKGLSLCAITDQEKDFKLCQIINKTCVKGGHIQLNLNDGRNLLIRVKDPQDPQEETYQTYDTLKIQLPDSERLDSLKFEEGSLAIVTDGKNIGRWGQIVEIEKQGRQKETITLRNEEDQQFKTIRDYVFPIGKGMPWISMLRGDEL
jgi:small subunit ribosomal protein S4e